MKNYSTAKKFLTLPALLKKIAVLKKSKKKIVFTNGCFDLIHIGHVRYLRKARSLGDILVIGVNTDASVRLLKGPSRPVVNQNERAEVLAALECVDFTVLFDEPTPEKLITKIKPAVLVKGGDWKVKNIAGGLFVRNYGGKVFSLPFVKGRSTTNVLEKIIKSS